jgi:protein TonB
VSTPDFADLLKRLQRIEAKYAVENSELARSQEQTKSSTESLKSASTELNRQSTEYAQYEPVVLYRPNLRYPPLAYLNGLEGKVMVAANISANGSLTDITIKQSSGHELLDYAAGKSAQRWRFAPPPPGVTVPVEIPFVFEGCINKQLL